MILTDLPKLQLRHDAKIVSLLQEGAGSRRPRSDASSGFRLVQDTFIEFSPGRKVPPSW